MKRKLIICILVFLTVFGAYLRLHGIGKYSFWCDELYHVFAAQNINNTGEPLLPSGVSYTRSLVYTYMVAISFKLFGVSESAARLPSALMGILMIPAAYLISRRLLGVMPALILAGLISLSPYQVAWSQVCRMYSLLQLLYLLIFYACYAAGENVPRQASPGSLLMRYIPGACLLALAVHTHHLAVMFILSALVYCTGMTLLIFLCRGGKAALRSGYLIVSAVTVASIAVLAVVVKCFLPELDLSAYISSTPVWAMHHAHDFSYYREILHTTYPIFAAFFPLALVLMMLKKGKLGLYTACCFVVPFLALSLIFPWKDERYMFFIFPLFLMPIAFLGSEIIAWVRSAYSDKERHAVRGHAGIRSLAARYLAIGACCIAIAYPAFFPWIKNPPSTFIKFALYDMHPLASFAESIPANELFLSTGSMELFYYSRRHPDYQLATHEFVRDSARRETDRETGTPIIADLETLKKLESGYAVTWFITDNSYMKDPSLSKDFQDHIKSEYIKLPVSDNVYYVYRHQKEEGTAP